MRLQFELKIKLLTNINNYGTQIKCRYKKRFKHNKTFKHTARDKKKILYYICSMQFSTIIGQDLVKAQLTQSADHGRIPHAQLFVGPEGSGTLAMAIAYAQYVLCSNNSGENNSGDASCNIKFENFSHPDLHFIFPVNKTDRVKQHPTSADYMGEWREFVQENPYGSFSDWMQKVGFNTLPIIGVDQTTEIFKKIALKSYEGGHKVMIIWCADRMNEETSNKLLKMLEEPPHNTVFILVTESEKALLQTILSRCQITKFNGITSDVMVEHLKNKFQIEQTFALKIAHQSQGNYNHALKLIEGEESDEDAFDQLFVQWVRTAFRAKGNISVLQNLMEWSDDVSKFNREQQKNFLKHCLELFRQAFLLNYNAKELVYLEPNVEKFTLEKFAPFVNQNNIHEIFDEISQAIYHLERGSANIIFTDLSIKLTRLIHKK